MKKNYNYQRQKLQLPEYGRHIQQMVNSLLEIEDRDERNRQAQAVIAVMGNLNPLLRDTPDYTHKLWDHLYIISDFKLDVDSIYPYPTREELNAVPERMEYPQQRILFKHYGKYVAKMIEHISTIDSPELVDEAIENIVKYMRAKSYEFNQEHPNNESIIKDIRRMSKNGFVFDENTANNIHSNYKGAQNSYSGGKGAKGVKGQKGQKNAKNQHSNQQQRGEGRTETSTNWRSTNRNGQQNRNFTKKKGYNRNNS
ncbi:MAG: DUF4290 domain-containing protein [Rikenellaceae bacterium]